MNRYAFRIILAILIGTITIPAASICQAQGGKYDYLYEVFDYNHDGIINSGTESRDFMLKMKELEPDRKVYDRRSGTFTEQSLWDTPAVKNILGEETPREETELSTESSVDNSEGEPIKGKNCDHDYVEKTTKEPTCTESGEKTYTCSKCKDSYTEEVSALGHDYTKDISKEPTCTEQGTATYTCSRCGDSYEGTILSTGHKASSWEVSKEAACETPGEKVLKCSVCGEVMESETIPATGHIDGDWEVEKAPGLFSSGSRVVKCTKCGKITKTMDVPRLMPLSLPEFLLLCFSIVAVIGLLVGLVARILKRKKAAYN